MEVYDEPMECCFNAIIYILKKVTSVCNCLFKGIFKNCSKASNSSTCGKVAKFCINATIFLACLTFVLYQAYECVDQYLSFPQQTQVYYDSRKNHIQPNITLCPSAIYVLRGQYFKREVLRACNIHEGFYVTKYLWSSELCPDPAEVYENALPSFSSWFDMVELSSFETKQKMQFFSNSTDDWEAFDMFDRTVGPHVSRCYTLKQSSFEHIGLVALISVSFKGRGEVILSSHGELQMKDMSNLVTVTTTEWKQSTKVKVSLEEHQLLKDSDHQMQCNDSPGYNFDKCALDEIEKESMKMFGCTTMAHTGKEHICRNQQDANKVMQFIEMKKRYYNGTCAKPCTFLSFDTFPDVVFSHGLQVIDLEDTIKVIESEYSYSLLSMVAEVGGHVGLFLGVAVIQVSNVFIFLLRKCYPQSLSINWKKVIRFCITAIISLACLAFVLHQTYECIEEYVGFPQSTQIYYDSRKDHIQPVITVCPSHKRIFTGRFYKKRVLHECNLSSFFYTIQRQWSSSKCPNPAAVYGSILPSFTTWFKEVEIEFLETKEVIKVTSTQLDAWQPIDDANVVFNNYIASECFTLKQSATEKHGPIKTATFSFRNLGRVYLTSPGQFQAIDKTHIQGISSTDLDIAKTMTLAYEEHQTLVDVIHKKPCNNIPGYSYDQCILNELEKESLETIGCTTTIHFNKTNICRDTSNARMAVDLLETYKQVYNGSCSRPCNFISSFTWTISEISEDPTASGRRIVHFEDTVKVLKSDYTYSFLSLVAEIGGHVGLFLGVAVVQLSEVLIYLVQICYPKF